MGGGPCDSSVSPSPFGLDFGTLDFGTSDLGLTKATAGIFHTWNREGWHDPAVGVQHVAGDVVVDAGDGGADQVITGDQEARDEQDGRGGPVMQLEERGVDLCLGAPVASLDQARHRHQQPHDRHRDTRA